MDKVQDCIVIANLAQNSSFVVSNDTSAASVAVELNLKDGETLSNDEAKTIEQFVLKCVPDLKPENVSIVDSKMHYYDVNSNTDDTASADYSASRQRLEQMKDVLSKQALAVLEPAMGAGNVAVSVNLSLDFDKQTVSKVEFAPPVAGDSNGLIRSSNEISSRRHQAPARTAPRARAPTVRARRPMWVRLRPRRQRAPIPAPQRLTIMN